MLLATVFIAVHLHASDETGENATTATSKPEATDKEEERTPLEQMAYDLMDIMIETSTPGAGIAIVSREKDIWIGGLGYADFASKTRVDADTMFRIGSISKMFVALSALKMQEDGLLKLTDPLRQHVSDIPFKNPWSDVEPITIAHLLEHTSGFDDLHYNEEAFQDPDISLKEALLFNPHSRKSRWRPGEYATYSNVGAPMAAYVIEKLAEAPFEQYVEENFFEPLGMVNTDYRKSPAVEELLATGYGGRGYVDIIMRPSGSINSSAAEMAKLLKFFINRGEFNGQRLISETSIERMETTRTSLASKAGDSFGYGLNNNRMIMHGYTWQGHGGSIDGYKARLAYHPRYGVGFAVMINTGGPARDRMSNRIARFLADMIEEPPIAYQPIEAKTEDLKKYEGAYQVAAIRNQFPYFLARLMVVTVSTQEGELKAGVPFLPGFTLKPKSDNIFYINNKKIATASFFKNYQGQWTFQKNGKGGFRQVSAWFAWGQIVLALFCILMAALSLLIFIVLACGRLAGRFKNLTNWKTRLMPSYATFSLIASSVVLLLAANISSSPADVMGKPSFAGVANFILRWSYPIFTVWACWLTYKVFRDKIEMNWFNRYYLLLSNLSGLIISAYMLYWVTWLPIWMY